MKLDDNGAAFFVEGFEDEEEDIPPELATSPLPNLDHEDDLRSSGGEGESGKPKYNEADLEAVKSRSLMKEFAAKEEAEAEDTVDEAPKAVVEPEMPTPTSKAKMSKNKRTRKARFQRHSRGGSKTSLKEVMAAAADVSTESSNQSREEQQQQQVPINENAMDVGQVVDDEVTEVAKEVKEDTIFNLEDETTTTVSAENNLLLSRLPRQMIVEQNDSEAASTTDILKEVRSMPNSLERMQYFSEPEITPGTSPMGSRPSTPVMSDTEFETQSRSNDAGEATEQSWEWGQLPNTTPQHHSKNPGNSSDSKKNKNQTEGSKDAEGDDDAAKRNSGWLTSFFRGSDKSSNNAKKEENTMPGVYLDEIKGDDEEMLKIYVGRHRSGGGGYREDDDNESGNGPSLPMSPNSVEGAIGYSSDADDTARDFRLGIPVIDISFCGMNEDTFTPALFEQTKISFDDFVVQLEERPDLLQDPDLVVRIGQDQFLKWESACPMIMSHVMYGRSLPTRLIDKFKALTPSYKNKDVDNSSPNSKQNNHKKSSWWPFTRNPDPNAVADPTATAEEGGVAAPEPVLALTHDETASASAGELAVEVELGQDQDRPSHRTTPPLRTSSTSSDAESEADLMKKGRYRKTLRLSSDAIVSLYVEFLSCAISRVFFRFSEKP